jgi:hypothetical protein
LSYIVPQANTYNSLQTLNHLQDLNYYFSEIAFLTIENELTKSTNTTSSFPGLYSEILPNLEASTNYLLKDYSSWSYCSSSKIINQNILPIWTSNPPKSVALNNLMNFVQSTLAYVILTQGQDFLSAYSSNTCCIANYSFYMYFNALPISVNQLQGAINDLVDCESRKINDLTVIVYYLMIGGFSALGLSFGITLWYLVKIHTQLNLCWNHLLRKVRDKYSILKRIIIDRLAQYHKIYEEEGEEDENDEMLHKHKNTKLHLKFYWRYMIRFSILFILSGVLYLVAILVFYNNIKNYLNYRLEFVSAIGDRRTKLLQLSYFTIQQTPFDFSLDTATVLNYTLTPDIILSFNETNEVLIELRKKIQSPSIYNYMPSEIKTMLYDKVTSYNNFLKYGVLSGIDYYRYESMCYLSYNCRYSNMNVTDYFTYIRELTDVLTNIASLADSDSKTQIENELNSLIYFTTFILLFFIVLYSFYYLPYLASQQETIKKIELIIKTIPETESSNLMESLPEKD